jgi:hypothetical protein
MDWQKEGGQKKGGGVLLVGGGGHAWDRRGTLGGEDEEVDEE